MLRIAPELRQLCYPVGTVTRWHKDGLKWVAVRYLLTMTVFSSGHMAFPTRLPNDSRRRFLLQGIAMYAMRQGAVRCVRSYRLVWIS